MVDDMFLKQIYSSAEKIFTSSNDLAFLKRVWNTPSEVYQNRLKAIGFLGKEKVLDAGYGMFQWTYNLSLLNSSVYGIELSEDRFEFSKQICEKSGISNINLYIGNIESTGFEDDTFDAIFCYSVIMMTDFRLTLKEFYRILKPGGILYFNSNGLGWYIYNLKNSHNDTGDFSSYKMAVDTLSNSIYYYYFGKKPTEFCQIATPSYVILEELRKNNFKKIRYGGEGTISLNDIPIKSFFQGEYEGLEGVIEYFCYK